MKKNTAVSEPAGYAEVGTYMYRNGGTGKVSVKMHTSVNKPLALDDADEVLKVKKIRVETHVFEDKGLADGVAYTKDIETIQITDGVAPTSTSSKTTSEGKDEPGYDSATDSKWNKNLHDENLRDKSKLWMTLVIVGGIAALTLGLVIAFLL